MTARLILPDGTGGRDGLQPHRHSARHEIRQRHIRPGVDFGRSARVLVPPPHGWRVRPLAQGDIGMTAETALLSVLPGLIALATSGCV